MNRYYKISDILTKKGWTLTRAGRRIDPLTGVSYTNDEAWEILDQREHLRLTFAQFAANPEGEQEQYPASCAQEPQNPPKKR